ncbi:MAG TPA: ImmA/IrrE family metallo-endopeptidase, partial [Lachnospiraceae bacterium]
GFSSMNYLKLYSIIFNVYKANELFTFPLDSFDIISAYVIDSKAYQSLPGNKPALCKAFSQDAFLLDGRLYYNALSDPGRLHFTFMHELGHILLGHQRSGTEEEQSANCFASHMLAPRILINQLGCKSPYDIQTTFGLSRQASTYAFESFCKWKELRQKYPANSAEKRLLQYYLLHNSLELASAFTDAGALS